MILNKLCARPHDMPPPLYAAAQLQPIHALRLKSLYQRFKKCDDVFIRFDTVPALDIRKRIGKTILRCACIAC